MFILEGTEWVVGFGVEGLERTIPSPSAGHMAFYEQAFSARREVR